MGRSWEKHVGSLYMSVRSVRLGSEGTMSTRPRACTRGVLVPCLRIRLRRIQRGSPPPVEAEDIVDGDGRNEDEQVTKGSQAVKDSIQDARVRLNEGPEDVKVHGFRPLSMAQRHGMSRVPWTFTRSTHLGTR